MVLFINACVRQESRTKKLADALLSRLGDYEEIRLDAATLPTLNENTLSYRQTACQRGDYASPLFDHAKWFAAADTVVIAAPYWDLSFPAVLKQYLEAVCVSGLTFRYTEEGVPVGLCRAGSLYYVTTAGGYLPARDHGFDYVRDLAEGLFGIRTCRRIAAEGLDIVGNDPAAILQNAIDEIGKMPL